MSEKNEGRTFGVLSRQILAIPVDGGIVIAERLQARVFSSDEAPQGERINPVGLCCCGCLVLVWALINVYMIIIGALAECSVESRIGTYVIVQGSFNFVLVIVTALSLYSNSKDKESLCTIGLNCCNLLLIVFLFIWAIAGSAWVWGSLDDWQDDHSVCNNALFISATICLSLHYVKVLLLCCSCICYKCSDC